MTIYSEVLDAQELLESCYDQETGEIISEREFDVAEQLKAEALSNGIGKLCKINANLKAEIEALKAEEKRIAEKRKIKERSLERLKNSIKTIMEAGAETKIKDGTFTVSLRLSEAVKITNEDLLPMSFKRISYEIAKKAIKEAIASGNHVAGAEIVVNTNVIIK